MARGGRAHRARPRQRAMLPDEGSPSNPATFGRRCDAQGSRSALLVDDVRRSRVLLDVFCGLFSGFVRGKAFA